MVTVVVAQELLRTAFERYEEATAGEDAYVLVEARYELTLALVADGWRPPPTVVEQMALDRAILDVPRVIELSAPAAERTVSEPN
ncbi:MAG: hypothetical protein ABIO67_10395 [Mycobacteriales bacterium]